MDTIENVKRPRTLLALSEVARILGLHITTIYRAVEKGSIPVVGLKSMTARVTVVWLEATIGRRLTEADFPVAAPKPYTGKPRGRPGGVKATKAQALASVSDAAPVQS